MRGRLAAEAVNGYLTGLQRAISCITDAVVGVRGGYDPGRRHIALLANGLPVRLRGTDIAISLSEHYHIVADERTRDYHVEVQAYHYALHSAKSDAEIIAFHWHPDVPGVPWPHIHLLPATGVQLPQLQTAHIPPGRVPLEEVIRHVIRDFRVRPLRADWGKVLGEAQSRA